MSRQPEQPGCCTRAGQVRRGRTALQASLHSEKALGPNIRRRDQPEQSGSLYPARQHAEAEPLYKRSLAIREKALGPDHPDVANSLNNLAVALHRPRQIRRGGAAVQAVAGHSREGPRPGASRCGHQPEQSGRAVQRTGQVRRGRAAATSASLAIREKALGPEHPDVAHQPEQSGRAVPDQGKYAEAEPLYKRSLAIREKALGPDHPDVATSLNNLAGCTQTKASTPRPSRCTSASLAIREKALGPDHPDVARQPEQSGWVVRTQGKYAEAEPLYKRVAGHQGKGPRPGSSRCRHQPEQPGCAVQRPGQVRRGRTAASSGRWPFARRPSARSIPMSRPA